MSEKKVPEPAKVFLPVDGNGNQLKEGDRVYVFGINYDEAYHGVLKRNIEYPHISDWYVAYDNGEELIVLDFSQVYKEVE
jgi:hypothetical protein